MSKRNLYLNTRPVEEAIEIYTRELSEIIKPQTETKLTSRCLGLVTSEAVYACCCSPLFNAAAMDGLIERIEEELGKTCTIVATGGLAKFVIPFCKREIVIDDDLLLKGLKIIYDKNR